MNTRTDTYTRTVFRLGGKPGSTHVVVRTAFEVKELA